MALYILDAANKQHDVEGLLTPAVFRQMEQSRMSPGAFLNRQFDTGANATVCDQLAAQMGFILGHNRDYGIRPSTLDAIFNPTKMEAGAITRDADLAPRVFFPIFAMSVLETALRSDNSATMSAYNDMVAVRDSIDTDNFERPLIDFTAPEGVRGKAIAQLSEPTAMVRATLSSKIIKVTSTALGMEYSDQAARALSLELLMKGLTRQAEMEAIERVQGFILAYYNGDTDLGMAALSTVTGAVKTAQSLDSTISAAGVLTQKAWVKFLYHNALKRTITHVITDLDGALAIQNRTGRPVVTGDNGTSKRIDTLENVINPMWPDEVKLFITTDASWPANTIVGLDKNYAIHHVDSTLLSYSGAEEWAIRRSTKLRFDTGSISYRLFDDA
ncbi:MAG: hypothetical protein HYZ18_12765, partial [Pseudogulbenkiania sp.]|nr:hypothetical protein [Pseudogulbenkiania sp.]